MPRFIGRPPRSGKARAVSSCAINSASPQWTVSALVSAGDDRRRPLRRRSAAQPTSRRSRTNAICNAPCGPSCGVEHFAALRAGDRRDRACVLARHMRQDTVAPSTGTSSALRIRVPSHRLTMPFRSPMRSPLALHLLGRFGQIALPLTTISANRPASARCPLCAVDSPTGHSASRSSATVAQHRQEPAVGRQFDPTRHGAGPLIPGLAKTRDRSVSSCQMKSPDWRSA